MCQEIGFRPGRFRMVGRYLPTHHIATDNERQGSMPHIFELAPFDLPWLHRQSRMFPFERLSPRQFVGPDHAFPLLRQGRCGMGQVAYIFDVFGELWVIGRG
jgi:hypothetical protein